MYESLKYKSLFGDRPINGCMKCHSYEVYISFSWDFGCFNLNPDSLSFIFLPTLQYSVLISQKNIEIYLQKKINQANIVCRLQHLNPNSLLNKAISDLGVIESLPMTLHP